MMQQRLGVFQGVRVSAIALLMSTTIAFAQQADNREEPGVGLDPRLSKGQIAPVLEGLGNLTHPVTAKNERVQMFFDQGLRLTYGFNHREAARAMNEALRLDPNCAMAYWGLALVSGPNLNAPMDADAAAIAYEAIQNAVRLKSRVTESERTYIDALAARYSNDPEADRAVLDQAYADSMKKLFERYPDDPDAATLYCAALMNQSPWDYWDGAGEPYERTKIFVSLLNKVTREKPEHPGAHHYFIHAVEAEHPERAVPSAEALDTLMPGAGHMVHMPSHIYIRVGRYAEASASNERAILADEGYITQCKAQGIYPLAYYPHNIHFLWAATTNEGRSEVAIEAARKAGEKTPDEILRQEPSFQTFKVVHYAALTRFGKWDEILRLPEPDEDLLFMRAFRHYARGMAQTRKGNFAQANRELDALSELSENENLRTLIFSSPPQTILAIARTALAGELLAAEGELDRAIVELTEAVGLQDALPYNEPPDWHYPIRQSLGAVLLMADMAEGAEGVYREDLRKNPENGWSLFGLVQSLRAQGKDDQALEIEARFTKAWAAADVTLSSSRF